MKSYSTGTCIDQQVDNRKNLCWKAHITIQDSLRVKCAGPISRSRIPAKIKLIAEVIHKNFKRIACQSPTVLKKLHPKDHFSKMLMGAIMGSAGSGKSIVFVIYVV